MDQISLSQGCCSRFTFIHHFYDLCVTEFKEFPYLIKLLWITIFENLVLILNLVKPTGIV